jgi:hypothetical protein
MILLDFIKDNDNWEELLYDKCVQVKHKGDLAIFNYNLNLGIELGKEIDFTDPIVKVCRGTILDLKNMKVVCFPFNKFGNYTEYYADDIDWSTARVQQKVDGSIVKLYWYDGEWRWATNSMIDASDAGTQSVIHKDYLSLIRSAVNYHEIPFDDLNKDFTFIFELVSPENRVVIKYNKTMLWHIGTRSNISGKEYNSNIGIIKPKEYPLNSLDDCIKAVEELNTTDICEYEGFVVVDNNYNRVKIKSMQYLTIHRMLGNGNLTKKRMIELIIANENLDALCKDFPSQSAVIYWYKYQMARLELDLSEYLIYITNLWEEIEHDRKAFANTIKADRLSSFGFKWLKNQQTAQEMIDNLKSCQLEKFIEDYK